VAALLLGRALGRVPGQARDDHEDAAFGVAVALELMDGAILAHYYRKDSSCAVRLLSGDRAYARAMRIVADLGRPRLVEVLARATGCVARGHSLEPEGDVECVLALRASLCPAAAQMGDSLAGESSEAVTINVARCVGAASEAVLAGEENSKKRLDECATKLGTSPGEGALFGEEHSYVMQAVRALRRFAEESR